MSFLLHTKTMTVGRSKMIKQCCCSKLLHNARYKSGAVALVYGNTEKVTSHLYLKIPTFLENNAITAVYVPSRAFYVTPRWRGQEPSSKVEETVKNMKEQKEEKDKEISATMKSMTKAPEKAIVEKRTIWQKVKAEMLHYYHGFRLLGLDIKISVKLIWRILRGKELSRREHRLLVKTTGDVFRLIPFSVFIIVPFMEFLLPVAIKLFPGLLPSTFQTATEKEDKLKQALKVKIEMAKFLQKTLDDMALQSPDHASLKAKEFADFFYKVRTTGAVATNDEIIKFSKVFEDEITLDSLSRPQLIALCRVLDVQTLGTTNFLRFLLRMRLRSLAADDKLIEKEGVESLTRSELQQACRARGMRAYGMPESKLKEQISQWLDLSLIKKVPPSLLLLSRALMVPDTIPMSDKLKATISALPDTVVARTKGAIGEKEGKVDHRTNIEIIKQEERRIEEEREEREKQVEPQPVVASVNVKKDEITSTDVKAIEQALESIGKDKHKMSLEKEEIKELKEEMAEYQEDIQELYQMKADAKGEKDIDNIKISKGAKRLFNKVNKMINKMDAVLLELEQSERKVKQQMEELGTAKEVEAKAAEELVKIDELVAAIKQIQNVPDDHRLKRIAEILGKIDDDRDGAIKIEDVLKVVEIIGKEDVKLSKKQVDELIELMDKEEVLEVEEQIQKTMAEESKKAEQQHSAGKQAVKKETELEKDESKSSAAMNDSREQAAAVLKAEKSEAVRNAPLTSAVPSSTKKAGGQKQL